MLIENVEYYRFHRIIDKLFHTDSCEFVNDDRMTRVSELSELQVNQ